MAPPMYDIQELAHGQFNPGPDFMERSTFYLKCQFASTVLFWSRLWAVKGCFLAFFWHLSNQTLWPRRYWWVVMVVMVLGYIGSVITYPVSCTSFVLGRCETPKDIRMSTLSLRFSTVVDMATDFLSWSSLCPSSILASDGPNLGRTVIVIPIWLTIGLKMSTAQKIGLLGVLCLGVVTMVFAAVRVAVTSTEGGRVHPEVSWLALWSSIESSVPICVACMTSFRVLFTQLRNGPPERDRSGSTSVGVYGRSFGSGKAPNNSRKAWMIGAHEVDDLTSAGIALEKFGVPHAVDIRVEAGAPSVASDRDWGDRASQERILRGDRIRVHRSWRVEKM